MGRHRGRGKREGFLEEVAAQPQGAQGSHGEASEVKRPEGPEAQSWRGVDLRAVGVFRGWKSSRKGSSLHSLETV